MTTPLASRPKISDIDVSNGYVMRYFVKFISHTKITEVDKNQYSKFLTNPFYETLELRWIIGGIDNDFTKNGQIVRGTKYKNQVTIDFYNKKMNGLNMILTNPLEYFNGNHINA